MALELAPKVLGDGYTSFARTAVMLFGRHRALLVVLDSFSKHQERCLFINCGERQRADFSKLILEFGSLPLASVIPIFSLYFFSSFVFSITPYTCHGRYMA